MVGGEHEDEYAHIHIEAHVLLDDMVQLLDTLYRIRGDLCKKDDVLAGDKKLVLLDWACMEDILVGDFHMAGDMVAHVVEV